jgi:hypothetical protein
MATASLEDRVRSLELEVAQLKSKVEERSGPAAPWWERIVGTFAGDPLYLEAMRLGREYRESLRPKPRKRRKSRHGDT